MAAITELHERLCRLAGVHGHTIALGGIHAEEFRDILFALEYIGNRKVDAYGNFRLEDIRSWDRETWGAYWDLQRKFGRLETQLANTRTRPVSIDAMLETLQDQAVYCVRMMQILLRLEERGMVPKISESK